MSVMSNFSTHVEEFPGVASSGNVFRRLEERNMHKFERAESSFLDTIVGCRGSLRKILLQVEAVAAKRGPVEPARAHGSLSSLRLGPGFQARKSIFAS